MNYFEMAVADSYRLANESLHHRTFDALLHASAHLNEEDLSVLCFHAGIPMNEILHTAEVKHG